MNTTLAILLVVMLAFCKGDDFKCKTFSCGSIDNTGKAADAHVCAKQSEDKNSWDLQKCGEIEGKKYICSSNDWGNIDSVTDGDKLCVEDTSDKGQNLVAGDKCDDNFTCMDGITCESGVCKGIEIGTACSAAGAHGSCIVGAYCGSDGNCAALKKATEACTATDMCARGHTCLQAEGDEGPVCYKNGAATDGKKYTTVLDIVTADGGWATICDTKFAKKTGDNEIQCQKPPKNDETNNGNLKQSDTSNKCKVITYTYDGETSKEVEVDKDAFCGFGTSAAEAFCDKYIGDDDVQARLKTFDGIYFGDVSCNIVSSLARCDKITSDQLESLKLGGNTVFATMAKAWAAVAGNDDCAKDTINAAWWAAKPLETDFAFGLGLKTIGAVFIAFTSFVMMF